MNFDYDNCPAKIKIESIERELAETKQSNQNHFDTIYKRLEKFRDRVEASLDEISKSVNAKMNGLLFSVLGGVALIALMYIVGQATGG